MPPTTERTIRFDFDKIRSQYFCERSRELLKGLQIPILEALDRVISDGENEVNVTAQEDPRLEGHNLQVKLDKRQSLPAPIYVLVDGRVVAQYTYQDDVFIKRTYLDFIKPRS